MKDKPAGKKSNYVGFRCEAWLYERMEAFMDAQPLKANKSHFYVAALRFYLEAAERFGIDRDCLPLAAFLRAKAEKKSAGAGRPAPSRLQCC